MTHIIRFEINFASTKLISKFPREMLDSGKWSDKYL